jgi:hypothetical protein
VEDEERWYILMAYMGIYVTGILDLATCRTESIKFILMVDTAISVTSRQGKTTYDMEKSAVSR